VISMAGDDLIRVGPEPLDLAEVSQAVRRDSCGAIASFVGVVRNEHQGRRVQYLIYEAYAPMAEAEMARIAEEIHRRWKVERVGMVHRTGRLEISEASVIIAVAAPHRREALEACAWAIEELKKTVPIWKKEFTVDGGEWVLGDPSAPR